MTPAAARIAAAARAVVAPEIPPAVIAKVKLCLRDVIGCACETQELPWAVQARPQSTSIFEEDHR